MPAHTPHARRNRRHPRRPQQQRRKQQTQGARRGHQHPRGLTFGQAQHARGVSEPVDTETLAKLLITMGCPEAKSGEMAQQLAKRSGQLAKERNQSHSESMAYLLGLMKQGWAAQQNTDAD